MTAAKRIERAVLVSPRWRSRPNHLAFSDLLARASIDVKIVTTLEEAHKLLAAPDTRAQCVILDADAATTQSQSVDILSLAIRRLRAEAPAVAPIVVATLPSTRLVTAVFRAGAADVVDLATSDESTVLEALETAARDHDNKAGRVSRITELRGVIEDFLRVLVRAERRTLELEDAAQAEGDPEPSEPQVLVVDDDRDVVEHLAGALGKIGLAVHRAASGEDALQLYEDLEANGMPIDLALVDKNLPGMNGLETIRELRARHAGLPCILITGYSSGDAAVRAADLGVVGYVLKPFDDIVELATRVKLFAERFAAERRERRYLDRIKKKHAQFLERYRQIVADLDRLKD